MVNRRNPPKIAHHSEASSKEDHHRRVTRSSWKAWHVGRSQVVLYFLDRIYIYISICSFTGWANRSPGSVIGSSLTGEKAIHLYKQVCICIYIYAYRRAVYRYTYIYFVYIAYTRPIHIPAQQGDFLAKVVFANHPLCLSHSLLIDSSKMGIMMLMIIEIVGQLLQPKLCGQYSFLHSFWRIGKKSWQNTLPSSMNPHKNPIRTNPWIRFISTVDAQKAGETRFPVSEVSWWWRFRGVSCYKASLQNTQQLDNVLTLPKFLHVEKLLVGVGCPL